jgi:hypothetical protein
VKIVFDRDADKYAKSSQEDYEILGNSRIKSLNFAEQMLGELRSELSRLECPVGYPLTDIGKADASGWDGGYCLHEEDGYWLVYHSERGMRATPDVFSNVQNAVNFFLWIHIANPSAHNKDVGMLPRLTGC